MGKGPTRACGMNQALMSRLPPADRPLDWSLNRSSGCVASCSLRQCGRRPSNRFFSGIMGRMLIVPAFRRHGGARRLYQEPV